MPDLKENKRKTERLIVVSAITIIIILIVTVLVMSIDTAEKRIGSGDRLLTEGKYDDAVNEYLRALEFDENNLEIFFRIANAYKTAGRYDEAARTLEELLILDDRNEQAYLDLMEIYYIKSNTEGIILLTKQIKEKGMWENFTSQLPSVPSSNYPSGFYEEDITVELTAEGADYIVYTLSGNDPSYESTRYEEPIKIEEGKTIISAAAVSKYGFISPIIHFSYELEKPEADELIRLRKIAGQINESLKKEDFVTATKLLKSEELQKLKKYIPPEGIYYMREKDESRNGLGTAIYAYPYSNGLINIDGIFAYYGDWMDSKRIGTGMWITDTTYTGINMVYYDVYIGSWVNDRPNGTGKMIVGRMDGTNTDKEVHNGTYANGVFTGLIEGQLGESADSRYKFNVTNGKYNLITAPKEYGNVKNVVYYVKEWVHAVDDNVYKNLVIGVPGFQKSK